MENRLARPLMLMLPARLAGVFIWTTATERNITCDVLNPQRGSKTTETLVGGLAP